MAPVPKRGVQNLLTERRQAMGSFKFKPENYYEIQRVLGSGYAPDLNRVVSKHRADAASAYLRRLHRDVERSQGDYYEQVHAMPLQIKSLVVKREDIRNFKSLLIPKLKLSPLPRGNEKNLSPRSSKDETPSPGIKKDPTPSPRTLKDSTPSPRTLKDSTPFPRTTKSLSPAPPMVSTETRSNYVPHKYFSPHSHTHIHVLFKQMPGSTSPRHGPGSEIGSWDSKTEAGTSSVAFTTDTRSTKHPSHYHSKTSPRGSISMKVPEEPEPVWPQDGTPVPFVHPKFVPSPAPLPYIKKRLAADRSPRTDKTIPDRKSAELTSPVKELLKEAKDVRLPPRVAAALAAESSPAALYKFDLPSHLAASYNKNLPSSERPKAMVLGSKARLPLPSIPPKKSPIDNELLAIISVQTTNGLHAAA